MNWKRNLRICVWERKKINSFEIAVIILNYLRNLNLSLKKGFKIAELLPKHPFSFTLETALKMAKNTN